MLIGAADPEAMTPEQRSAYDAIAAGPRGHVPAPFLAMLDTPELASTVQAVGKAIRFAGTLPDAQRELAILATAAAFGSGYEWNYHVGLARNAGLSEAAIGAARDPAGTAASELDEVERAIVTLCWAAVRERTIPPEALERLVARAGRPAATEVVAIAGYYPLLALYLAAVGHDVPMPGLD